MSDKGSVFQKGGGGTNFEQSIHAAFLTTLVIRGNVPCVPLSELTEVAFQVTNRGYQTDDLLAIAKSPNGEHRLLIQVKHDISFTTDNEIFKKVISDFWKDYSNTSIFDKTRDKLIIVKNGLTKDERNHLKSLFNWATNHATETDFLSEVDRIQGKKGRLDVFRAVLKEANNNTILKDKELWEFLKCVDVLEYDFLNEGSIDKTYFLNLIKLSKSKNSTATEKEIWDSILAYVSMLNKDGGSATFESIKEKDFYQHFDQVNLNPYFKAVQKLISDSQEILRPIKTSIGKDENELNFPRIETREKILEGLSSSQITNVIGKPGVGKSAEIKKILQRDFPNASIFVFRADQFNESTLANVFSSQGVNETIQDIFSCIALIPEKIIFIDSLEKLLEADPECAFTQLLALLKEHPEIKVIASSRKFAIDLITLKFGIDKGDTYTIEIPTLDESELKIVTETFPQLSSVLKNEKIKKLLQSPKYLDFSMLAISRTNDDYTCVSLTEFKDKLWNSLVADSTNTRNGLPIKRESAFIEIAVKRAKEMKLFTKADKSDAEAIACLEKDEIVFQENQNRKYSPTHDILEDWALVKYVSSKFEDFPHPKNLFSKLGNEPAIRRAFRLWIEDYLIENSGKINELIRATVSDQTIEKYWADELLIAVFKSENSNYFFTAFKEDLLVNNAVFFNRCLHIIKTCCKESDPKANHFNLLLPIGSGWKEALLFIQDHITQLEVIKLPILNFVQDWYYRLLFLYDKIEYTELQAVKFIVLFYLQEIETEKEFWLKDSTKDKSNILISILYDLAPLSKEEIKQLIARAFAYIENRDSWKLKSFYKKVIEQSLSGIGNQRLINELPELIVEIAWRNWKYIPPKREDFSDDRYGILARHSLSDVECWGIRDKHSFFPSGIYKSPVFNMLLFQPLIGLKFIIDFINYSVEFYVNSSFEYKHEISQIEIELNDGTVVKQYAAWELWAAYRGSSVTNYALESLLMSLEKFLLETANRKTDISKTNLKFVFDYVLRNSNNVAPLAVLTSVATAYPDEVEEAMLPLLSVKEFYEWDLSRALQEHTSLAPMDNHIPFAQNERMKSNQLPHRKKYHRGLSDFIVNYQFNIGKINQQIHNLFDKLHANIKGEDVMWKKLLNEMDIRTWEVQPYDEKLGGFVVQPKYEKEVAEFMASNQDYIEKQNAAATYSGIITNAHKKGEAISYEKWSEYCNYYRNSDNLDILFSKPITLAVLGLSDFSTVLIEEQQNWCIETITKAIGSILEDTFSRNYSLSRSINLMEKEIALSSFHLLMHYVKNDNEKDGIIATMVYMLFAPFPDHELDKILQYIREVFFKHFPDEAKRVWLGLIKYSTFKKTNSDFYRSRDENDLNDIQEKEEEFVRQISSDKSSELDLSEISLEKCEGYLLARAFVITPYNSVDKDFSNFVNHLLPFIIVDLDKEEDYSYSRSRESRQFHHSSISDIEQYLSTLFLDADYDFSKSVFSKLVESVSSSILDPGYGRNDLLEFVGTTLDYFVLKLYDNGNLKIDQTQYLQQQTNFWNLWDVLFNLIPANGNKQLIQKLLLDIRYLLWDFNGNPNENEWNVLNGKKEIYKKWFLEKGRSNASSVINVFSTIGGKAFLPEGISWLTEIFKSDTIASLSLTSDSAERMVKRLFYKNISKIKSDKTLIDDYVWILDRMVDLGSSEAYLFRENVITYKSYEYK